MTRANRWSADFRPTLGVWREGIRGSRSTGRRLRALLLSIGIAGSLTGCFGGSTPAHSEYFVVPFEADTAQPTADGRRALTAAGEAAKRGKVSRVVVQSADTEAGKARAAAARESLIVAGVPTEKIAESTLDIAGPADGSDVTIQVVIGTPARPEKE